MEIEINIPSVGESVKEATLAEWFRNDDDMVTKDEPLFAIETDKVTLEVVSPADGVLHIRIKAGDTAAIGAVAAVIDTAANQPVAKPEVGKKSTPPPELPNARRSSPPPEPESAEPAAEPRKEAPPPEKNETPILSPAVRHLVAEHGLDAEGITGTGREGRITKADVLTHLAQSAAEKSEPLPAPPAEDKKGCVPEEETEKNLTERKPMSPIRKRIAQRLVAAKQNTAMLTTFNEIDMSEVMAVRTHYKDAYREKYGVSLGFMSFFIKACTTALHEFPQLNAFIEGDDIVYHHYVHMGIAIGGKRGLVVPVIRYAEKKSYAELEKSIVDFVEKIDRNKLELNDLEGGTFTISNGGVYGSLLSTPILNMPQSGILGMHKIEKRPVVAEDDQIVIRPMMYVALSYDHRVVDGREAVSFLKRIKEFIEDPQRIMLEI